MTRNKLLILLAILVLVGCTEPPTGIAHSGIKEAYPFTSFGTNVYSESMIRTALGVAKADSTHQISGNTHYVLTFEMDKSARWRNTKEDSIIMYHINESDAIQLAAYTQKESSMALYVDIDDETITDLILLDDSKETFKVYEFVGEMPLQVLMRTGINNFDDIKNLITPTTDAAADTSNI